MDFKMNSFEHVLPDEVGETRWFDRQNPFEQEVIKRQVKFKRTCWPGLSNGRDENYPDHLYCHILPAGCEYLSIYEPIAMDLFSYLSTANIKIHPGIRNLKSSQAACFNIMFPLKQDLRLAKLAFSSFLPNIESVDNIEFEYTGPAEITEWLGEPSKGMRGENRTSIDAAIFWTSREDRRNITLVEWKYTERNFGSCSMYSSREHRTACDKINLSSGENPAHICPLSTKRDGNSRRYWEHMKSSGISLEKLSVISGCPFRTPLYQIMRQCVLAAYLREKHMADFIEVLVVYFEGNSALLEVPPELKLIVPSESDNIISIWNHLLHDVPPVRYITVEQVMENIDTKNVLDHSWREYIKDRYKI